MFSGKKVKEMLDHSPYRSSDLAEYLCNNKKRSLSDLFNGTQNPRADTLEKLAQFFHVSIDSFFVREDGFESSMSNEQLTRELWLAQKATLEAEIAGLYKQVELLEEVRDGLKRELDMVKSGAQKKKNAGKSEGGKASV